MIGKAISFVLSFLVSGVGIVKALGILDLLRESKVLSAVCTKVAKGTVASKEALAKTLEAVAEAIGRRSMRILDEIADVTLSSRVKELRNLLTSKFKRDGNFGYANASIDGLTKTEYYAHSGIQELTGELGTRVPDISLKPTNPDFKSLNVNPQNTINGEGAWDRIVDTEFKILDEISKKLNGRNASGTIKLFTELPPCPSCDDVILQFLQKYPNIKIEVIHNNGVKLLP
jgi:hypothetical protein